MGIYVDNSATTPVHALVKEAMEPFLADLYGNPSSLHEPGHIAHEALNLARQKVSSLLQCKSEEIYFTNCGTMANNTAILGRARFAEANNLGKHLITSSIEHSSILGPVEFLQASGWQVTYLPVDGEGFVSVDDMRRAIKKQTSLITLGWANNEIGTVQPVEELAQAAAEHNIFFHCDAIQIPGKLSINLNEIPISALSISGHKFQAPKGIGALFLRNGQNIMPLVFGGGQEQGIFPGTESVAHIVALGKAAQLANENLLEWQKHLQEMQTYVMEKVSSLSHVKFTGPKDLAKRLPGHVSLVVPGVSGETMILRADLQGIYLSSGSACSNKVIEPSHVLRAIGLSDEEALGAVRISFGRENSVVQAEEVGQKLENIMRLEQPFLKAHLGQ